MTRVRTCYALACCLHVITYPVVPSLVGQSVIYTAVSFSCGIAILVGVRRFRPAGREVWYWLAAGHFLTAAGDVVYSVQSYVLGIEPFPSLADAAYLLGYGCMLIGLLRLLRRSIPGRDRAGLLDASIIVTALGILAWVFVLQPIASDTSLLPLGRAISIAYPVFDLLLLALLARLVSSARSDAGRSARLLVVGFLLQLVSDVAYLVANLAGVYSSGWIDLGWMSFYALTGVAALHPTMKSAAARGEEAPSQGLTNTRLLVLAAATLLTPAVLIIQVAREDYDAVLVIGAVSAVLFTLVVLRMAGLVSQIQAQAERLAVLARVDGLTEIANRRAWDEELVIGLARAQRSGQPVHVALLDLDHFKRYNDHHGHPAGDGLLKSAAERWRAVLRPADVLARYGGEEFAVLLEGGTSSLALQTVERLRACTPHGQTVSAGVATWDGRETGEELVARADAAMYEAKHSGRDRSCYAQPSVTCVAV